MNLGSLDLESDALPTEPPHHPLTLSPKLSLWLVIPSLVGKGSELQDVIFCKDLSPNCDLDLEHIRNPNFSRDTPELLCWCGYEDKFL